LLEWANASEDPAERLALVTTWIITQFFAHDRPFKPFAAFLGETFQLEFANDGRFIAEQVSVNPPVAVAHAESNHFTYDITTSPRMQITGNSADLISKYRCRIKLREPDEEFYVLPAKTKFKNLMMGPYVDHEGELIVVNQATGHKAMVGLKPCKAFGRDKGRLEGTVLIKVENGDNHFIHAGELIGRWNELVEFKRLDLNNAQIGDQYRLWPCPEKPANDPWQRTQFGVDVFQWQGPIGLLPSDSRRRPDVAALAERDYRQARMEARQLKMDAEYDKLQRRERREAHAPVFFAAQQDGVPYEHEPDAEWLPFYTWNDRFPQVAERDYIRGRGFRPWAFPRPQPAV